MPQEPVSGKLNLPTTLVVSGRNVPVLLPNNYNAKKRYKLRVFLHGYGSDAVSCVTRWFGNTETARHSGNGTICLLPVGLTDLLGNACWNSNGSCCALDMSGGLPAAANDTLFLSQLIELAISTYSVDLSCVEVYGYSNGAMMAHTMGLCYSQRITAIYTFAGYAPFPSDAHYCVPGSRVHVTMVGVAADAVVLYDGDGTGTVITDKPTGPYLGQVGTADQWKTLNGCTGNLTQYDAISATDVVAGNETLRSSYPGQAANGSIELWRVTGALASHSVGMNTTFIRSIELRSYACRRV